MRRLFVASALLLLANAASADARADYLLHCGGCHLPNGNGTPPDVPTLHNDLGTIVGVPRGREYLIRVPGAAQSQIDDAGLARILNWILSEYNAATLPEGFRPISAKEVSASRRKILADPLKFRAEIWPDYE
jgi:mono/diheme cytochrome c family protein